MVTEFAQEIIKRGIYECATSMSHDVMFGIIWGLTLVIFMDVFVNTENSIILRYIGERQ